MKKNLLGWISAVACCGVLYVMSSCANMDSPSRGIVDPAEKEKLSEVLITDTTELGCKLFGSEYKYIRVNYTYYSVDVDGATPLKLSSALVFSKNLFDRKLPQCSTSDGKVYDAAGLLLMAHFTLTAEWQSPTRTDSMEMEGPISVLGEINEKNCIMVSPDFSGFGVTKDKPQAYLMGDIAAKQALDALDAAKKVLAKMNYTYAPYQALIGYSQGGHTAMAIQRYLSRTNVVQPFNVTCAGGGPYDLTAMVDTLLQPGARTYYPCAVPLMFVETNESMKFGLDYSKVFREPLNSKIVQWVKSKTLKSTDINDSICKYLNTTLEEGVLVSDMLNTDYVVRGNPEMEGFYKCMEENTLVSGWTPTGDTRYYLYHSEQDQVVPYFCFKHMRTFMEDAGLTKSNVAFMPASGDHVGAASFFVLGALSEVINAFQVKIQDAVH